MARAMGEPTNQAPKVRRSRKAPDFFEFSDELSGESDRGAVLVAATRIDELLRDAIGARLVDHPETGALLTGFNAPLGSFSARILSAFALGILSEEEYRRATTIRKIRNIFAHELGVDFKDQRIVHLVANLEQPIAGIEHDYRRRFLRVATTMVAMFTRRAEHVAKDRLQWKFWGFTDLAESARRASEAD